jgi:hypothetical protein
MIANMEFYYRIVAATVLPYIAMNDDGRRDVFDGRNVYYCNVTDVAGWAPSDESNNLIKFETYVENMVRQMREQNSTFDDLRKICYYTIAFGNNYTNEKFTIMSWCGKEVSIADSMETKIALILKCLPAEPPKEDISEAESKYCSLLEVYLKLCKKWTERTGEPVCLL